MVTDTKRREVAARLRKAIGLTEFAEVLGFNWTDDRDWVWKDVSNLVADLIEPSCDRDALLALADELDSSASMLLKQNDLDPNRKRRGMRRDHAKSLMAASGCIRKALGVES